MSSRNVIAKFSEEDKKVMYRVFEQWHRDTEKYVRRWENLSEGKRRKKIESVARKLKRIWDKDEVRKDEEIEAVYVPLTLRMTEWPGEALSDEEFGGLLLYGTRTKSLRPSIELGLRLLDDEDRLASFGVPRLQILALDYYEFICDEKSEDARTVLKKLLSLLLSYIETSYGLRRLKRLNPPLYRETLDTVATIRREIRAKRRPKASRRSCQECDGSGWVEYEAAVAAGEHARNEPEIKRRNVCSVCRGRGRRGGVGCASILLALSAVTICWIVN